MNTSKIDIENTNGFNYLLSIDDNSIDLILTDPPYIISKDSGMNTHYEQIKYNKEHEIEFIKTNEDWYTYINKNGMEDNEKHKMNYLKYGTIYGKKYGVKTEFGEWDNNFSVDELEEHICKFYKKLKEGGTMILFFDLWKISYLKDIMVKYKFKQIRFIEWLKTNPQPLNSGVNYLTNAREIALVGIKGTNPTFHSHQDYGVYEFPFPSGRSRFHPTQKPLGLFELLIKKHSNINDVVLDTFLGSGTTAVACKLTGRHFKGCEVNTEYYEKIMKRLA